MFLGLMYTSPVFSQGAHSPPPADCGTSGNQDAGGGAPIGGGLGILLTAAGMYGIRK